MFSPESLEAPTYKPPPVITVDKNPAYPAAAEKLRTEGILPEPCILRQVKVNNIVEQDHRFIKRFAKPGLGFQSFHTAWRTLRGYETMHMIRKGQAEGIAKGDIKNQIKFIEGLFPLAA